MPSGAPLDIGAVVAQLKDARAQAGGATATTINFIVYVGVDTHKKRAHERARALSQKYPARVIIFHGEHQGARVVTAATKLGASGSISAECIELGTRDLSEQAICSAISTLRVADVPSVLWWISETVAHEHLFGELIGLMDTIIVDSSGIAQADSAIRELAAFLQRNPHRVVRDLAYMRLAPWQDMVAQFFDDPRFLSDLHRINRVEITSGSCAEAYYLVGWLASRLHWKPCGPLELCANNGQRITVALEQHGDLRRVLRFALSTEETSFCAELTDTPDTVCLSVTGLNHSPERCSPLQHIDTMSLLEKSFLNTARDEVFEASLGVLQQLLHF